MTTMLSNTLFPTTKHIHVVFSEVYTEIEALTQLSSLFLLLQTDRLHGEWDKNAHTLTIQGFVHSSTNC